MLSLPELAMRIVMSVWVLASSMARWLKASSWKAAAASVLVQPARSANPRMIRKVSSSAS